MPRLDGLSLCRRIKSDPRTRFVPVIIVTALDEEDEKLRAIQVGADDFIGKPFKAVILLTRVRSLLIQKHLHDELDSRNRLLQQVLNRYVDQDLAQVILTDPERHLKLGGETRQVTVLFADLRGFTEFAARHPASRVVETVNRVFEELTHVIFEHGGTFDKFLGDAILAFYGAPFSAADDARRALCSALDMQARFARLQRQSPDTPLADLQGLGIGVHTGEAIVGNIGSERVMDYTVIGNTVNIARRLQEAAPPGEILISGETLQNVPTAQVAETSTSRLRKNSWPVRVFALEGLQDQDDCIRPDIQS